MRSSNFYLIRKLVYIFYQKLYYNNVIFIKNLFLFILNIYFYLNLLFFYKLVILHLNFFTLKYYINLQISNQSY